MRVITDDELKSIQMQIMDYVDRFCRENKIEYTLSSGTLLGAVRHGGFIPWDDDIDIHLLRNEYDKLTRLWNEARDEHPFELVNIESGNNMGYPFGKVHDPRTVTFVGNVKRTGVFIDVFPVDYVLSQEDLLRRYKPIAKLYSKRSACLNWMDLCASSEKVSMKRRIVSYLKKPRQSYNELAVNINRMAKAISFRTDYVFEMVCGFIGKNAVPTEVYENYQDIKFEDRIYRSVVDFNTLLTKAYGDWRTPPPVEKQITHHSFRAYWLDC